MKQKRFKKSLNATARTVCFASASLCSAVLATAEDAGSAEDLKARVAQLEGILQKEGILPSGKPTPKLVSAMSDITISGFVQASYFYNTRHPSDGVSDAYLWNAKDNSFSINKVKLTLASKPVETDKWDAGFRTSLIWGEDAPNLNTGSPKAGFEALREAYVELNVPIGTGLNVKAGQLISLLNWESGDGGAANPNFSQGNQWWYTGNGPSAGVQLGYSFSDAVNLKVRVQNGMFAGPVDSNEGKAVIGSLGIKPCDKVWFNLIGWFSDGENVGGTPTDVSGVSTIGGYQATKQLGTGFEVDYFHFSPDTAATSSDLWSVGGWVWYDFTPKLTLAFRADYIDNPDGVLGPPPRGPASAIMTTDTHGTLGSLTWTLTFKPTANLRLQPEVRYDYTGYKNGLDGKDNRFIIGVGASYLF
jgi:hypothetical protein